MMNYHRDKQPRDTKKDTWALIVGVVLLVLVIIFFTSTRFVGRIASLDAFIAQSWKSTSDVASLFNNDSQQARDRIAALEQAVATNSAVEEFLPNLVVSTDRCSSCIYGKILKFPHKGISQHYMMSLGEENGIKQGDLVLVDGLYLLGAISETHDTFSYVQPALASGSEKVAFHREAESRYTLLGRGHGVAELQVPRDVAMVPGEWLYHPVVDDVVVGYVEKVLFDDRDPFQTILVRTPFHESRISAIGVRSAQ